MIYVLYHANCSDGFGSAYGAWKEFGNEAKYIPVKHYEPIPQEVVDKATEVYICDFCYSRIELDQLSLYGMRKVTVLDHHISAKDNLTGFREHVFDLNRSGSVITWQYLHSDKDVPKILRYVQDQDIWQWKLQHSHEVCSVINIAERDFNVWDKLSETLDSEDGFNRIVEDGAIIVKTEDNLMTQILNNWHLVTIKGITFPAVNTSILGSQTLDRLLDMTKDYTVAGSYYYTADGKKNWSLRGNGEFDCTSLATQFPGGGGHKRAAGFIQ